MVPPVLRNHVPATDMDFLNFINEFLFNPPPQVSSAHSTLHHQRNLPRRKRYRTMWRAAATALLKKRRSSQETHLPFEDHLTRELPSEETHSPFEDRLPRELPSHDNGQSAKEFPLSISDHLQSKLPSQGSLNNGEFSQATPLPSVDETLRNLSFGVSLDKGNSFQGTHADHFLRNLPSQVSLNDGHNFQATVLPSADQLPQGALGGLDTIDSQHVTHARIDVNAVEEASLITPACSELEKKGSTNVCSSKVQPFEEISILTIPKHCSRKPPRPPRVGVSRSGSYRAIRIKIAARRAMMDNERMRKQKLSKSTSNATSKWALVITLCFLAIMLIQGFLGSNSKDFGFKATGQHIAEEVSSAFLSMGAPPLASESSTKTLVVKHGAGISLNTLRKTPRDLSFMNLRRYRSQRPGPASWHLL